MAEDLLDMTLKLHLEARVKFCYYMLGLTTALLGLNVQFAEPSSSDIFPSLVFLSWGALVISLISGIRWQYDWITYTAEMHSGLLNLRRGDTDKKENDESENDSNISSATRMSLSGLIQVGWFIVGLLLFAVYKVINFYAA